MHAADEPPFSGGFATPDLQVAQTSKVSLVECTPIDRSGMSEKRQAVARIGPMRSAVLRAIMRYLPARTGDLRNMVAEGAPAPDFTVLTDEGKQVSLRDYRGHWVVLYFYPKADTPG
jgi:hypothetical protein